VTGDEDCLSREGKNLGLDTVFQFSETTTIEVCASNTVPEDEISYNGGLD